VGTSRKLKNATLKKINGIVESEGLVSLNETINNHFFQYHLLLC